MLTLADINRIADMANVILTSLDAYYDGIYTNREVRFRIMDAMDAIKVVLAGKYDPNGPLLTIEQLDAILA